MADTNKKTLLMSPPTWSGITPALLMVLEQPNGSDKSGARDELIKMARIADCWVEHCKNEEEKNLIGRVNFAVSKSDKRPISEIITSERKTIERLAKIREASK